jgi:hypothetical protein
LREADDLCLHDLCAPNLYALFVQHDRQECRAAYHGPVWELGKQADSYTYAEFDRIFAA